MFTSRTRKRVLIALRIASVSVCGVVVLTGRPPAHAQYHSDETMYDAMQDQRMGGIEKNAADAHDAYKGQWAAVNTLQQTVSGIQGEELGVGAVLLGLQVIQIVIGIRAGKKGESA